MNVFKKCLRKEFGKKGYEKYVKLFSEEIGDKKNVRLNIEDKKIYKDMYEILSKDSETVIKEKLENLSVTLYNALQIIRKFSGILFVYALANIVLLMLELDYYVTCASIAILGAAFLYKLLEFLENKFCFIDAYLIMIYKAVLEIYGMITDIVDVSEC